MTAWAERSHLHKSCIRHLRIQQLDGFGLEVLRLRRLGCWLFGLVLAALGLDVGFLTAHAISSSDDSFWK